LSAQHVPLSSINKDWLAWKHDNESGWSTCAHVPVDCCSSDLSPKKYNTACWSSTEQT